MHRETCYSTPCAAAGAGCRDCWCVAIGNSYDNEERCILAGYDNGDVKMFDLRMNKVSQVRHMQQQSAGLTMPFTAVLLWLHKQLLICSTCAACRTVLQAAAICLTRRCCTATRLCLSCPLLGAFPAAMGYGCQEQSCASACTVYTVHLATLTSRMFCLVLCSSCGGR
jgi:hypothetical protein